MYCTKLDCANLRPCETHRMYDETVYMQHLNFVPFIKPIMMLVATYAKDIDHSKIHDALFVVASAKHIIHGLCFTFDIDQCGTPHWVRITAGHEKVRPGRCVPPSGKLLDFDSLMDYFAMLEYENAFHKQIVNYFYDCIKDTFFHLQNK